MPHDINITGKPCRQWAAEILALPESERHSALLNVPAMDYPGVCMYLDAHEIKREGMIAYTTKLIMSIPTRAQRKAALTATPSDIRKEVEAAVMEVFASRGHSHHEVKT